MNTLVGQYAAHQIVDYIKMDIEGAERDVLRLNTEWATRVRCIKVELHGGYTKAQCIGDLSALGFEAWADSNFAYCVVGVKSTRPGIIAEPAL